MDAVFLYAETGETPLHVMGALVLESHGRGPREDFRRIRAQIEQRLPRLSILRRKLVEAPLGLVRPVWVDDSHFDLDAHLRRAALPAPGGDAELFEAIARIAEVPLHRDRPLWEMWVIEGLERGRFAIVAKIHHSAVDGIGGAQLMCALLDVDRNARAGRDVESEPEPTPEAAPSPATLLADAALSLGAQPLRGTWQALRTTGMGARLALASLSKREFPLPSAPRTQLNRRVTSRRAVALGSVPLADVKRVKNAYAATVNHVVLAACAGALRQYLGGHGEIPRQPLVAAVPMALEERPADGLGNSLTALLMRLPVHLADPIARLHAAREASLDAMRTHELIGNQINEWADLLSPTLVAGAVSLYTRLGLAEHMPPLVNLVMSNVPGPTMPLYCAGAKVTALHPIGPIYDGCALNLTVMSYDGALGVGAIACPDAVPAVDEIPRAFEASVAELLEIVDAASPTIAAAS
ncbi:MAG TPA: wax ester/triacylglycerol synthase family O-acyltransferase [Myxococcota bacterium]|nr:wax ester/triacylglycerol synthase family O-acyltransferase [Myxococcota bacterium]